MEKNISEETNYYSDNLGDSLETTLFFNKGLKLDDFNTDEENKVLFHNLKIKSYIDKRTYADFYDIKICAYDNNNIRSWKHNKKGFRKNKILQKHFEAVEEYKIMYLRQED